MKAIAVAFAVGALAFHAQAATRLPATSDALADAMRGARIILLGEVHDNAAQHALRAQALRAIVQSGVRPAIAFEQFDASAQAAIDQARRERPRDVDYLVAQARGAAGWNWALYKPFIALALEYDLPVVAANLSRADAMQMASAPTPPDAPAELVRAQEEAAKTGHCNLLPPEAVPGIARAQIARDRALAQSIAPHAERGVVLLTGNGHARKDIGVPRWLAVPSTSIALVEDEDDAGAYDYYVVTERATRPDPCEELRKRTRR